MEKLEISEVEGEQLLYVLHNYIQRCLGGEEDVMNPKNIDTASFILRLYRKLILLTEGKFRL